MSYEVIFSEVSYKQLCKLEKETQERIIKTLKRCRIRPYPHVRKLVGSRYFRLRAGDYRVILDILENKLIIHVIEVGHRKEIYKK